MQGTEKESDPEQLVTPNVQIIMVLEQAPLQIAKIMKKRTDKLPKTVLLDGEEHKFYIERKLKKSNFSFYKPQIVHRALLTIFDSPLHKAGNVQVYVNTAEGKLIFVDQEAKLPRTTKRFNGLFAQLLEKGSIQSSSTNKVLLKVMDKPLEEILPEDCLTIGTSIKGRLIKIKDYIPLIVENDTVCFVVGAVAHGYPGIECDYIQDCVSISKYNLSSSLTVNRILAAFENHFEIH